MNKVKIIYNNTENEIEASQLKIDMLSSDEDKLNQLGEKLEEQYKQETYAVPNQQIVPPTDNNTRWTQHSIKLLLEERFSMNSEFESPKCKKNKLWGIVSKKMLEKGYVFSLEECHNKYRNLLQTYKSNKEKSLKKPGESAITWEYYEIFDEVLGHKASTFPPKYILSTSIDEANKNVSCPTDLTDIKENVTLSPPAKKIKIVEKSKKMDFKEYLFEKNEREKQIWNEKKILKEKQIEAIFALANAVNSKPPATKIQIVEKSKKMDFKEYLFEKNEREKQIYNEKKNLNEKQIEAIFALANAINSKSKNLDCE